MAKKNPKKEPLKKRLPEEAKPEEKPSQSSENEGKMDFGGLPDRDLKKNLGCG